MARTPSQIPKWFDAKTFQAADRYKAREWAIVVHCIGYLFSASDRVQFCSQRLSGMEHLSDDDYVDQFFSALFGSGKLHEEWEAIFEDWNSSHPSFDYDADRLCFGSVESISAGTLAGMAVELEQLPLGKRLLDFRRATSSLVEPHLTPEETQVEFVQLRDLIRKPFVVVMHEKTAGDSNVEQLEDEEYRLPWLRTLHVNLSVPDDQIKRDFDKWLVAARDFHAPATEKKVVTPKVYRSWAKDRLFPLASLMLWRQFSGRNLSWAAIHRAVYWDQDVSEATVKRTLKEKVEEMARIETLRALWVQLRREELTG